MFYHKWVNSGRKSDSMGYSIKPQDIVDAGKRIREEAGPVGAAMTHTDVRMKAIRCEMEK